VETAETLLVLHDTSSAVDAATEAHDLMQALVKANPGRDDFR
jgi:hypothetical protein